MRAGTDARTVAPPTKMPVCVKWQKVEGPMHRHGRSICEQGEGWRQELGYGEEGCGEEDSEEGCDEKGRREEGAGGEESCGQEGGERKRHRLRKRLRRRLRRLRLRRRRRK